MTEQLQAPATKAFTPGDRIVMDSRYAGTLERVNHEYRDDHWFVQWDDGTPRTHSYDQARFRAIDATDEDLNRRGLLEFTADLIDLKSRNTSAVGDTENGTPSEAERAGAGRDAKQLRKKGYQRVHTIHHDSELQFRISRAVRFGGQLVALDGDKQTWVYFEGLDGTVQAVPSRTDFYEEGMEPAVVFPVKILQDDGAR